MNTIKKKLHFILIPIVGGLLLTASLGHTKIFALNTDTSGSSTSSNTDTSTPPPSDPSSGDTTDGSTAGDTGTTNTGTTSSDPTTDTSGTGSGATDADTTDNSGTNQTPADTDTTDADQAPDSSSSDTPVQPTCPTPTTPDTTGPTDTQATNTTNVNNCTAADAQSGDASVTDSSQAGDATSGDAADIANLVNAVQSSSNLSSGSLQIYTDNINGDQNGDIDINPADFTTPATTTTDSVPPVSVTNNTNVNNTVDLTANSGDATVENNGIGGDATTGSALTEANIINLLDSMITDNSSFLDIINIYGNLTGNILIPSEYIDGLLGDPTAGSDTSLATDNDLTINNNVNLAAQSGDATVSGNHTSGNATSGDASTDLNIYNLVNSQITGGNLLLVFVNVSGNWVGFLLNDPAGTTTATLGGEIQQYMNDNPSMTTASYNTETVTNNVNLDSTSGNALVADNHVGGNATSGNATSDANLVNILGSNINLSGWLGILVINVFGSWTGSLQILTTSSTIVTPTNGSTTDINSSFGGTSNTISSDVTYIPLWFGSSSGPTSPTTTNTVASYTTTNPKLGTTQGSVKTDHTSKGSVNYLLVIIGLAAGAALLIAERIMNYYRREASL